VERLRIQEALASNYLAPVGPMVDGFEADLVAVTGIPHVLSLSSGTAALHLALRCVGLNAGDEVWASTLTFIGSVAGAVHAGAKLKFVESDPSSWCMSSAILEEGIERAARIGRLPVAVVPTDLFGQSCDLDEIMRICSKYEIPVICDSAEAIGARYKGRHAGKGADLSAYSFNGNKIVTTSGGGALASEDPNLIAIAKKLSTQAREPVIHYEHREVGYNYRLSNILAALGRGQLETLEQRVARRRWVFDQYVDRLQDLSGLSFMPEASYGKSNRWLTVIVVTPEEFGRTREDIRTALERENIESRPIWKPMHLQPVFQGDACLGGGHFAEQLFANGLCLPSGTALTESDIDRVTDTIRRLAKS